MYLFTPLLTRPYPPLENFRVAPGGLVEVESKKLDLASLTYQHHAAVSK